MTDINLAPPTVLGILEADTSKVVADVKGFVTKEETKVVSWWHSPVPWSFALTLLGAGLVFGVLSVLALKGV